MNRSLMTEEERNKEREYFRKWRAEHHEKLIEYSQTYHRKHRHVRIEQKRLYKQRHPVKFKAQLRNNKNKRNICCKICGSKEDLERHHFDYSKPREITTLCRVCHQDLHNKEREVGKYAKPIVCEVIK